MTPALTKSSRFAEKPVPICPLHICAMGSELTTSSRHTEGCTRVTSFIGTGMAFSLDLSLLNSEVKILSLGTCIAILQVHCSFLFVLKMCLYGLIFIPGL